MTLFSLGDASGEIDLAIYSDVVALTGPLPPVQVGDAVQVSGTVSFYRDSPQIALTDTRELVKSVPISSPPIRTPGPARTAVPARTRTPTPAAAERTIVSLSAGDQDQRVVVSARIAKVSSFSKGTRYTLDDGSGTIILLLWSDLLQGLKSADAMKVGAQVRVKGKIDVYENELELVPEKASDVTLLALSVLPTPAPRTIKSLKADEVGSVVMIAGTAKKIQDFSQGEYVTLVDGTGEVRVTVFNDVLKSMSQQQRAALTAGAKLTATGELSLYRGELELVADRGGLVIEH